MGETGTGQMTAAPLHLRRLEIESFLRVSALTVDADGKHIVISGKNGAGKTSAVDAIWAALGGRNGPDHTEPIQRGASKSSVRLDLGEFVVERHWSAKGSRLVVTPADGGPPVKRAQELLDGLLGRYALDPIAFLDRRPQDQVNDVLAVVGVEPPIDAVQEIIGENLVIAPKAGESASGFLDFLCADNTGMFYQRRRDARVTADHKKASLDEHRKDLGAMGGPIKESDREASVGAIIARIDEVRAEQDIARNLAHKAVSAREEHQNGLVRLRSLRAEHGQIEQRIIELSRQLDECSIRATGLAERIARTEAACYDLDRSAAEIEQQSKATPDPSAHLANLREALAKAEDVSRQLSNRRCAQEQVERLAKESAKADSEYRRLDSILGKLRDLRLHLLDDVDIGVPGLEVGNGELRLDGVTFQQASMSQRIRVACAVAMLQRPRLRLLRIDEGERLDRESREMLLSLADANGFQVVMTCVRDASELQVEIVDHETVEA